MCDDTRMVHRFEAFCKDYHIPEKHHGSLRMLAAMAFVLGFEIEVRLHPREEEEEQGDD
jgi:hypothetical protein